MERPQRFLFATNHFEKDPAILDFLFELADLFMAQVHVVVFSNEDDDKALTFIEHSRNIPEYKKS
jgi:flavodoxin